MQTKVFIITCLIVGIVVFIWFRISSKEYAKEDQVLTNHVRFSGTIISYNRSHNHAYGIIVIKITDTNTKEFADSSNYGIIPYKIKGADAEFYGYVPASIKVGNTVILDSDKRIMNIYDNKKFVAVTDVRMSSDIDNVEFVKQNTKFK